MAAVKNNYLALDFTSKELKNDKEVVLTAVKQSGNALEFASDKLKGDKEVVMAAINNNGVMFKYLSDELKGDKEVVLCAIEKVGKAYQSCAKEMQMDKDVILLANKNLAKFDRTVEDYLCDELIELKERYGVDTLEEALEREAAEVEVNALLRNITGGFIASASKRL